MIKLNTAIVDDDFKSRKLLSILLKKFPEVKVVGEASTVSGALEIIEKKKPDSIFLDICLGNDSGFKVLDNISKETKIVFISAYDGYALKAFEVNALDYLTKPIKKDRLALTISRLLKNDEVHTNENGNIKGKNPSIYEGDFNIKSNYIENRLSINEGSKETQENLEKYNSENNSEETYGSSGVNKKPLEYDDRLFVNFDGASKFIKISSIQCITAEKDYTYIYLSGNKRFLILKPMVEWEERLTPKYFVRIHRSTIVNLEYVEKVEKWFNSSYHVYIQNISEPFQMSRRYASKLKENFK